MRLCSLTFAACLWAGCASAPQPRDPFRVAQLRNVTSWACQLQGLERPGALTRIERARTDLIVLDPVRSIRGAEVFSPAVFPCGTPVSVEFDPCSGLSSALLALPLLGMWFCRRRTSPSD